MKDLNYYFDLARQELPHYPLSEVEALVENRTILNIGKKNIFKFKITSSFLMAGFISIVGVLVYQHLSEHSNKKASRQPQQTERASKIVQKTAPLSRSEASSSPKLIKSEEFQKVISGIGQLVNLEIERKGIDKAQPSINLKVGETPIQPHFPNFTQEEIDKNNKRKREIVKDAYRQDKKQYADLYTLGFGFVMQKTEVTNSAYRTFLMDLAIQNEPEKYELAKPDLDLWIHLPNGMANQLREHYFSHPAFDNYPVLTISRKGAELYCEWLSSEIQKMSAAKKNTTTYLVRLPTRSEWTMAASNNGKHSPYAWEGIYLRDYRGVYLANLNTWSTAPFSSEEDGGMYSVPVTYYSTNSLGLYNMCGNAAEMVYEDLLNKLAGTAGGSWMSSPEQIKISASDQYAGITSPSPYIGFRVVMLRSSATPK